MKSNFMALNSISFHQSKYSLRVSHLQFTDDIVTFAEKSWANMRTIKAMLLLFETMSGLKVNFHKSLLVGVNVGDSLLEEASSVLSCKLGRLILIIWVAHQR
jgi:hypothetical protein